MKQIPLTNSKLFAMIDTEDYTRVIEAGPWFARPSHRKAGGVYTTYVHRTRNVQPRELHRFILGTASVVDHINGDALDNRKINLREATSRKNQQNAQKHFRETNTSNFKGVHWHKTNKKWRSIIQVNGAHLSLGCFYSEYDAALAYDTAAIEYFGEFAKTNFPIGEN
jgi:HNH endonuclease/AP2 domain